MKSNIYIIAFFSILLLEAGCTKEPLEFGLGNLSDNNPDGTVKMNMYLNIPSRPVMEVRSADLDNSIDATGVYVLVFDGNNDNSRLTDWCKAEQSDVSGTSTTKFSATLRSSNSQRCLYIVANASDILDIYSGGWDTTATASSPTTLGGLKKELLTETLPVSEEVITAMPGLHPMTSSGKLFDRINKNIVLGTEGNAEILTRATVKITIVDSMATTGIFSLQGANLGNAPEKGYIFPEVAGSSAIANRNYGAGSNTDEMLAGTEGRNCTPLYCYESAASNSTYVLIKADYSGTTGYYRLNLHSGPPQKQLDLKRNYHYKVIIKEVFTAGYRTAQEAMDHPASNRDIDYDIKVEDLYSHDIVTNGTQYLGVSNSEFIIYGHAGALYDIVVADISYTTMATWKPGQITATQGITLVDGDVLPLAPSSISADRALTVNLAEGFTEGEILVRIGDLKQVISLKKVTVENVYEEKTYAFTGSRYVVGEVANPAVTSWLLLSSDNNIANASSKVSITEGSYIYAHILSNEATLNRTDLPMGYFFIGRSNNESRIKVCIAKKAAILHFDPNGGYDEPEEIVVWRGDKLNVQIPSVEPKNKKMLFDSWNNKTDGSGISYGTGLFITLSFDSIITLYAQWKMPPPPKTEVVKVGELYWATGNLIADDIYKARIGLPGDIGLFFKFGSLLGYQSFENVNNSPIYLAASPDTYRDSTVFKNGRFYTSSGTIITGDGSNGKGDPCTYYLGQTWRLPTKAEYDVIKAQPYTFNGGREYSFNGNKLFFPLTGGIGSSGSLNTSGAYYWSGTPHSSYTDESYDFEFNPNGNNTLFNSDYKDAGCAVRCVTEINPTP